MAKGDCRRLPPLGPGAMVPNLNQDALHSVCNDLAPDVAASLAACHLPATGGHVPHAVIDLPGAPDHATLASPHFAADVHHVTDVTSPINVDATVIVEMRTFTVDVPDLTV